MQKGQIVKWQPLTQRQRGALARFPGNWMIARDGTHTMLAGEIGVLIHPENLPDEARWVRVTQIIKQKEAA